LRVEPEAVIPALTSTKFCVEEFINYKPGSFHSMFRQKAFFIFLVVFLLVVPAFAQQDDPAPLIARIEAPQTPDRRGYDQYSVRELMDRFSVPGASIAVIKDFKIHWAKAYGVADVVSGALVDTDTLFQAASISKPVAAMGVLRAVQDSRFSLDADINTILKSWKVPKSEHNAKLPVTPRSLLSHTSGADDGFGFPGYAPETALPTLTQILNGEKPSNVGPVLFARPPYSGFKYSGGAVTIMQLAMMDVYGRPYPELLQELVLRPVGMTRSGYDQPLSPDRDRNAARAHNASGRAMPEGKWHEYPELSAAGLWTTPTDLAKFAIEIQLSLQERSNRVLSREMVRQMVSPVGVGPFGVGLTIAKSGEGWYFSHGGSNWGFRCDLMAHVVKGYGVAIMTNGDRGSQLIEEIKARVVAAYNWDILEKPIPR
jgi:CubicO group peptidase (beta-lactamase class C family)